jgi:hypothetical protein
MATYHMWNLTAFTTPTNYTTGSNSMLTLVRETSAQVGYTPGAAVLLSLFLVLLFALRLRNVSFRAAFAASSWATAMVALLMYPLQIINSTLFIICIALVPLSVLFLFIFNED